MRKWSRIATKERTFYEIEITNKTDSSLLNKQSKSSHGLTEREFNNTEAMSIFVVIRYCRPNLVHGFKKKINTCKNLELLLER